MQLNIPSTPNYLNFLEKANSIDDLCEWLAGATVTGVYEFKLTEDSDSVTLIDTTNVNFIAPDLAARHGSNNNFKFLRTSDNKFLCQGRDENA